MAEEVVTFDLREAPREQRITHAHVGPEGVILHRHPPGAEEGEESGIALGFPLLTAIAGQLYWKRPGPVEAGTGGGSGGVRRAEVHVGYVVLEGEGFREVLAAPALALVMAVLQGRKEAERRRAMMTHTARVSKHVAGAPP